MSDIRFREESERSGGLLRDLPHIKEMMKGVTAWMNSEE